MDRAETKLLLALLALAAPAAADPITLSKSTIDGGGASFISSRTYILGGTIGQPDAGVLAAGSFVLAGGFWNGGMGGTSIVGEDPAQPEELSLPRVLRVYPAVPNPTAGAMQVRFDLPQPGPVRVHIYDLRGALIRALIDRDFPAGRHSVAWEGCDGAGERVSAGLYFFRIELGAYRNAQKVVVVR